MRSRCMCIVVAALLRTLTPETASAATPPYTPVVTPNNVTLPWHMENGVKVFHLIAEPVKREMTPGMVINTWG